MDFQGLPVSLIMPDWGKVCRDRGERPGGAQYGNHIPWAFGELGANGDRDPLIFFFFGQLRTFHGQAPQTLHGDLSQRGLNGDLNLEVLIVPATTSTR